jgi:hypothetical protein
MTRLFVSYSHVDEAYRKRLGTALALLKRQGLVDVWTDREILPGEEIDPRIAAELDRADVVLLLVSPEFIESDYCYEKEMARALERHRAGKAVVIPLILRPCSWKHTSLGGLLAIPRDGTPVSKFADPNDAWHDVETEIRRLIEARRIKRGGGGSRTPAGTTPPAAPARASAALKLRRSFGDAERDDFIYEAFDAIADFFAASLQALERANADVKARFRRKNAEEFTATVYHDGKERAACRSVPRQAVPIDENLFLVRSGWRGHAIQPKPFRGRRRLRIATAAARHDEFRQRRPRVAHGGGSRGLPMAPAASAPLALRTHAEVD